MAARGGVEAQLDRLRALAADPSTPEAIATLEKSLQGKSNIVAARAANVVRDVMLYPLERALVSAFDRFMPAGSDKGCLAKIAIADAMLTLGSHAESVWLTGVRHVQMEPAWGRPVDAAVQLRCICAAGLVNMRSSKAIVPLLHLLAEVEPRSVPGSDSYVHTRTAAARALGAHGGDAAEALLRFKVLTGDPEMEVMGECFAQLIGLTRSLEPVRPYLDADDLRQVAMLAVGESRHAEGLALLRQCWDRQIDPQSRKVLCVAIALTRKPEAVDFLVLQVTKSPEPAAAAAVEALAILRADAAVHARVQQAAKERGGAVFKAFDEHFSS